VETDSLRTIILDKEEAILCEMGNNNWYSYLRVNFFLWHICSLKIFHSFSYVYDWKRSIKFTILLWVEKVCESVILYEETIKLQKKILLLLLQTYVFTPEISHHTGVVEYIVDINNTGAAIENQRIRGFLYCLEFPKFVLKSKLSKNSKGL
jgi:hypothetical protein